MSVPFLPDPRVREGAERYTSGDLDGAATIWSTSTTWGASYDRGTAALLHGDIPGAVVGLRDAAEGAPRREDVAHNLALARAEVSGAPPPVPLSDWPIVPSEAGLLAVIFGLAFSVKTVRGGDGARWLVAAMLLAAASVALEAIRPDAVVVIVTAAVRPEPDASARPDLGPLPPGSEVERLGPAVDGFVPIRDGGGRVGWLPADAISG